MNNKKAIFTGENYGRKIVVELDHNDIDVDQLFDSFETIALGLGFHPQTWKNKIIELAEGYKEDNED